MTKEDIYQKIAEKYGFTFDEIAEMPPRHQHVLLRGSRFRISNELE